MEQFIEINTAGIINQNKNPISESNSTNQKDIMKSIKTQIYDFIAQHPRCLFSELEDNIEGFKGDIDFGSIYNGHVYWTGMSQNALKAISDLIIKDKVDVIEISLIQYVIAASTFPNFEIGSGSREYKHPPWIPLAFSIKR
jgi:hypothetical protein